ncbi:MAG TPA: D-glycero-beta-D-manno-heptose-7-phosphate kinase [Leptospiraceae bacterium]|nr:D-glycero-beta-D-manno-heptose-7-phosphate kinase [Leptospiraceae bacterium]
MKVSLNKVQKALDTFSSLRILVLGDLILDEYLMGDVTRISPEAPVPVLLVKKEKITLGGSGNVVKNLRALGIDVGVFARVGTDEKSETAKKLLSETGCSSEYSCLTENSEIPTILKTRVIAANQQICRIDKEEILPLTAEEEKNILDRLDSVLSECGAVILSDYEKGYLRPQFAQKITELCHERKVFVSVDPQISNFFYYKKAGIMTPNHHEAGNALGRKIYGEKETEAACREIADRLDMESMMITRGEKGMCLYVRKTDSFHHIPTVAREVFDVTGAGDTVISLYTAFRASGFTEVESALISNAGAGIVVQKLGAAAVSPDELLSSLRFLNNLE